MSGKAALEDGETVARVGGEAGSRAEIEKTHAAAKILDGRPIKAVRGIESIALGIARRQMAVGDFAMGVPKLRGYGMPAGDDAQHGESRNRQLPREGLTRKGFDASKLVAKREKPVEPRPLVEVVDRSSSDLDVRFLQTLPSVAAVVLGHHLFARLFQI